MLDTRTWTTPPKVARTGDAIELSRLIDGSDIGPCAIPSLEQAVLRLRPAYSKTPPA